MDSAPAPTVQVEENLIFLASNSAMGLVGIVLCTGHTLVFALRRSSRHLISAVLVVGIVPPALYAVSEHALIKCGRYAKTFEGHFST